jgi:hypothetical protein
VNAPDESIGTPLENAISYGCWHVARRLVEAGATKPPSATSPD